MRIVVTRDSVAAGDDVNAPHRLEFSVSDCQTIDDVLRHISRLSYLPSISGGEATWSAVSGVPLAIFAQQWQIPKLLTAPSMEPAKLDERADGLYLHFNYHTQIDPEIVFAVLSRLSLRSF
ncbi:hypothetical protein [Cupriavidus sp. YR651]|uniref:hypothetical protein n=1 Tax=Cupriavidus sp. YR651 TaxID=1855315 RepID=UPI00115FB9AC|nr:hypothetical protein [Cupriavidus sp. YR651]